VNKNVRECEEDKISKCGVKFGQKNDPKVTPRIANFLQKNHYQKNTKMGCYFFRKAKYLKTTKKFKK
jgi:hypothetical protein